MIRGAEITLCDSHQVSTPVLHLQATFTLLCELQSTSPLKVNVTARLAPVKATVDVHRLAPALLSNQPVLASPKMRAKLVKRPSDDEIKFAELPFQFVAHLNTTRLTIPQ